MIRKYCFNDAVRLSADCSPSEFKKYYAGSDNFLCPKKKRITHCRESALYRFNECRSLTLFKARYDNIVAYWESVSKFLGTPFSCQHDENLKVMRMTSPFWKKNVLTAEVYSLICRSHKLLGGKIYNSKEEWFKALLATKSYFTKDIIKIINNIQLFANNLKPGVGVKITNSRGICTYMLNYGLKNLVNSIALEEMV